MAPSSYFIIFVVQYNYTAVRNLALVTSKVQEAPSPFYIWPTIFSSFVDFGFNRTQILFVVIGHTIQSMPPLCCVSYRLCSHSPLLASIKATSSTTKATEHSSHSSGSTTSSIAGVPTTGSTTSNTGHPHEQPVKEGPGRLGTLVQRRLDGLPLLGVANESPAELVLHPLQRLVDLVVNVGGDVEEGILSTLEGGMVLIDGTAEGHLGGVEVGPGGEVGRDVGPSGIEAGDGVPVEVGLLLFFLLSFFDVLLGSFFFDNAAILLGVVLGGTTTVLVQLLEERGGLGVDQGTVRSRRRTASGDVGSLGREEEAGHILPLLLLLLVVDSSRRSIGGSRSAHRLLHLRIRLLISSRQSSNVVLFGPFREAVVGAASTAIRCFVSKDVGGIADDAPVSLFQHVHLYNDNDGDVIDEIRHVIYQTDDAKATIDQLSGRHEVVQLCNQHCLYEVVPVGKDEPVAIWRVVVIVSFLHFDDAKNLESAGVFVTVNRSVNEGWDDAVG